MAVYRPKYRDPKTGKPVPWADVPNREFRDLFRQRRALSLDGFTAEAISQGYFMNGPHFEVADLWEFRAVKVAAERIVKKQTPDYGVLCAQAILERIATIPSRVELKLSEQVGLSW
jgi:hypothetical protein